MDINHDVMKERLEDFLNETSAFHDQIYTYVDDSQDTIQEKDDEITILKDRIIELEEELDELKNPIIVA